MSAEIFYPDLRVNSPNTATHNLKVQIVDGWKTYEMQKSMLEEYIECRVFKGNKFYEVGCRVLVKSKYLTLSYEN